MAGYTKEEIKERIKETEDDEIKMNLGWLDFSKPHGQILLKTNRYNSLWLSQELE